MSIVYPITYPGDKVKDVLVRIPKGSAFGDVMQSQMHWMLCHPQVGVGRVPVDNDIHILSIQISHIYSHLLLTFSP